MNRRRLLAGVETTGLVSVAGCLDYFDDSGIYLTEIVVGNYTADELVFDIVVTIDGDTYDEASVPVTLSAREEVDISIPEGPADIGVGYSVDEIGVSKPPGSFSTYDGRCVRVVLRHDPERAERNNTEPLQMWLGFEQPCP